MVGIKLLETVIPLEHPFGRDAPAGGLVAWIPSQHGLLALVFPNHRFGIAGKLRDHPHAEPCALVKERPVAVILAFARQDRHMDGVVAPGRNVPHHAETLLGGCAPGDIVETEREEGLSILKQHVVVAHPVLWLRVREELCLDGVPPVEQVAPLHIHCG